ncbi:MAG: hypothetical protein K9L62_16755 [Vallitaleaceae bacterium]|nr:hypothetical protein [Vallitaleaceae bacterium]
MREWKLIKTKDNIDYYNSNKWLCEDRDYAVLYIHNIKTPMNSKLELYCFSGIEASSITIDNLDIGGFLCKIHGNIRDVTLREQYLEIANYICDKFCDVSNNYKQGT